MTPTAPKLAYENVASFEVLEALWKLLRKHANPDGYVFMSPSDLLRGYPGNVLCDCDDGVVSARRMRSVLYPNLVQLGVIDVSQMSRVYPTPRVTGIQFTKALYFATFGEDERRPKSELDILKEKFAEAAAEIIIIRDGFRFTKQAWLAESYNDFLGVTNTSLYTLRVVLNMLNEQMDKSGYVIKMSCEILGGDSLFVGYRRDNIPDNRLSPTLLTRAHIPMLHELGVISLHGMQHTSGGAIHNIKVLADTIEREDYDRLNSVKLMDDLSAVTLTAMRLIYKKAATERTRLRRLRFEYEIVIPELIRSRYRSHRLF